QILALWPVAPLQRTGIFLRPGESVDLAAEGSWGLAGSPLAPLDQPRTSKDPLPLRAVAWIGGRRIVLARPRRRYLAQRAGELLLGIHDAGLGDVAHAPATTAAGLALVRIWRQENELRTPASGLQPDPDGR